MKLKLKNVALRIVPHCFLFLSFLSTRTSAVELPTYGVFTVMSIGGGNEKGMAAILDTGAKCFVPDFIEVGTKIRVDLRGEF